MYSLIVYMKFKVKETIISTKRSWTKIYTSFKMGSLLLGKKGKIDNETKGSTPPVMICCLKNMENCWRVSNTILCTWASLENQMVKNPPEIEETWVWPLGQEDSLEKGMAPHSSTLAWRIPWTEEPGGLQSMGLQRVRHYWATIGHNWATNTHTHSLYHLNIWKPS